MALRYEPRLLIMCFFIEKIIFLLCMLLAVRFYSFSGENTSS
uniref:Uncharacterized protein n=1 Tax=Arundo donax TaxID=35708 RepID=A0A0A8XX25_ARUDO